MSDYMKEAERLLEDFGHCRVAESILIRCGTPREVSCAKEKVESARAALLAHIQRGAVPEGWRDAVHKLSGLPSFLEGWRLSESCARNGMGTEVGQWIDGIAEIFGLLAAAPAPDQFRDAAKMMAEPAEVPRVTREQIEALDEAFSTVEKIRARRLERESMFGVTPAEVPMPEPDGTAEVNIKPLPSGGYQCGYVDAWSEPLMLTYGDAREAAGYARGLAEGVARTGLTPAEHDVLAERQRQISVEGWTLEHDDKAWNGQFARAASAYAKHAGLFLETGKPSASCPQEWPWSGQWWKPTVPRRDLVKAGALILAEIERLDRAARKGGA